MIRNEPQVLEWAADAKWHCQGGTMLGKGRLSPKISDDERSMQQREHPKTAR